MLETCEVIGDLSSLPIVPQAGDMKLLVPVLTQAKSSGLKLALHVAEVSQIVAKFVKRLASEQSIATLICRGRVMMKRTSY